MKWGNRGGVRGAKEAKNTLLHGHQQTSHECLTYCQVKPSVLHGDLWSGNISGVDGQPSIFDPAVYYGHSEADFGMSWCAGFSPAFYEAYHKVLPKAPGQHLAC